MGIGFVMLTWAVGGIFLAAVGGLVLQGVTKFVTQGARKRRSQAITTAALFPFACVAWVLVIFLFQAFINQNLLQRDPGVGEVRHCPLPNGYSLLMMGATDRGWIYNPTTHPAAGVGQNSDTVGNVRALQVAGRYILGAADSEAGAVNEDSDEVDSFFLLDTQSGKHMTFVGYQALAFQAKQLGIKPHLELIHTVYSRYRFSWFDVLSGFLFIFPPLTATYFLGKWIVKIRRSRHPALKLARRRPGLLQGVHD